MAYSDDITLIWLSTTTNEDHDKYRRMRDHLQQAELNSKIFVDSKECMDYMKTLGRTKILFVTDEPSVDGILCRPDELVNVLCFFVISNDDQCEERLNQKYSTTAVVTIPVQQESLVELVNVYTRLEIEQASFSLFDENQKSTRNFKTEFPSFLWTQLLLEVLTHSVDDRTNAMNEMLDVCKQVYKTNQTQLNAIETFSNTYEPRRNAINWYTKDSFCYRILNEALRTENIDYLYSFRFFISDMCQQLQQERLKSSRSIKLYRGQRMAKSEIDKLKQNIGSFISTNGFLSTSRSIRAATLFLKGGLCKISPIQCVLFEITNDPSVKSVIFADIKHLSQLNSEREVLFTLSSVFQIKEVYFDDKNLNVWVVKMVTASASSLKTRKYIDAVKNEYQHLSTDAMFASLLITMDELGKAELFIKRKLSILAENTLENAAFLVASGNLHLRKSQYKKAEEAFNRAYTIRRDLLPPDDMLIARSLNDLAAVCSSISDLKKAIEYNEQALAIDQKLFRQENILIAKDMIYLGKNYEANNDLAKALFYFDKALKMQKRLLLPVEQHSTIASTLWSIGLVYIKRPDYRLALANFEQALQIYETTLPCGHDQIIKLLSAIVDTYIAKENFRTAFEFCETKLNYFLLQLETDHPSIGKMCKLKGYIAFKRGDYDDALKLFREAVQILQKHQKSEYESILDCLKYLVETAKHKEDHFDAFDYLSLAEKVQMKIYVHEQPQVGELRRQAGLVHMHFKTYRIAEDYFRKALTIFRQNFNEDHDDVKTTLDYLKKVKDIQHRY
ncbi:unnamed protein product [Adineta ricciae]|uniref:NAD(P)(+)--arginine ADP-ribosyltransferase n=1 Tax=Adineta ricciae TaxID=249248 RepID=A0A815Z5C6_ADIRI|nr:unnamed protein product [Adineta ricciae]CAF1580408.1 unnamed protein product [Adineta ricciae]